MTADYLAFATKIARDAGEIMKRYFRAGDVDTIWKTDNTPVTIADTAINSMVVEAVKATYPNHGVHGEEESYQEGAEWLWVCDPVDGTMPYSIGVPISTFSLALTHKGKPILGVVYDPFGDRLFAAQKNQGAYMNGKPIHVSVQSDIKNAYIASEVWAGLGDDSFIVNDLPDMRQILLKIGAKPLTYSSAVMEGTLIASGHFCGLIFGVRKPEDIAAIKVIVEEAGGKVTDLDGKDQRYDRLTNGAIVSNGALHDQLVALVRQARA